MRLTSATPARPLAARRPLAAAAPRAAAPTPAPAPATSAYTTAVARIRTVLSAEERLKTAPNANGLLLQPNYESIFRPAGPNAKGTVVLYHGFSAGPWQYQELADKFHKAGYNVYAPRMPGHGLMTPDGKVSAKEIPQAHERGEYETFIDARFKEAEALGAPVYMVGLSGGGNLALRTAEKYSQVKRTAVMAPYVGPQSLMSVGTRVLWFVNKITFGGLSRLLSLIPFAKNEVPSFEDDSPHTRGSFGQTWSIRSVGFRLKQIPTPVQFLTTHGDQLSAAKPVEKLLKRSGGDDIHGWYHFRKEEDVPHAMVSKHENPHASTVSTIERVVFDFVNDGKQADRWP